MSFFRLSSVLAALAFGFFPLANSQSNATDRLTAEAVVHQLKLVEHVEGGFFSRTYTADYRLLTPAGDERRSMSSIFYLLAAQSPIGHFHLNRSDIVHYFHMGDPITYYLLHPDGELKTAVMGNDLSAGEVLQLTVPGGVWKASQIPIDGEHGFGLISEAVSPGFEYSDMTLGYQSKMIAQFPQHRELLERLSHPGPKIR